MSSLVPADANHIARIFVQAIEQRSAAAPIDAANSPAAAILADRILRILGVNGLCVMQAADGSACQV